MSFWTELKRRKVFTTAATYAVAAWLVVQIADVVLAAFELPNWVFRAFLICVAVGFVVTVVLAWIYEATSKGIRRERELPEDEAPASPLPGKRIEFVVIAILFVAVVMLVVDKYVSTPLGGQMDAAANPTLAVLAFANRSADPDDSYFADGLSDELLSVLARVRELRVASRTASFYFRGKDIDPADIASRLGVSNVLTGSVRREGDRVRVTVALDKADIGELIWSQSYDRKVEDLLEIQSEIAQSVATSIVPVLSPESRVTVSTRPTDDPTAYDYYLQGRDFLALAPDPSTVANAIDRFDLAIETDPRFADAFAGRCSAFLTTYMYSFSADAFQSAETACHRALTLDSGSAEVRAALGNLYRLSGQYSKAISEYEAGLAQLPNSSGLYVGLGMAYHGEGQLDIAETMFMRAQELESGSWFVHNQIGIFYGSEGRREEAVERFRRVIELTPESDIGYDNLGNTLLSMGDFDGARTAFEQTTEPSRWTYENRGLVYYYLGEFDKSIEDQASAVELAPDNHRTWGNLGNAYRLSGNEGSARDAYEEAIRLAEQSLTVNPGDVDTIGRLGTYLAYIGEAERADERIASVIDSDDAGVYYAAARVAMHHGDMDTAHELLRKTIAGGWARALVTRDPDFIALGGEEAFGPL